MLARVRPWLSLLGVLVTLAGCVTLGEIEDGKLRGRVLVEWYKQDLFIYRKTGNALSFTPSFMTIPIVPEDMITDGGSVPRILWSVPGLSPWGLGPAYIIHDWIFRVHRCRLDVPGVKDINFVQSAQALAEVGKALIKANLIPDDKLTAIVWAIRTNYARGIWDRLGSPEECAPVPTVTTARARFGREVAVTDFVIPGP